VKKDSILIKHAETLKYSEGRRIRTKTVHRDRFTRKKGWKANLHLHKKHLFFSDLTNANTQDNEKRNISLLQKDPAFQEGHIANSPIRFPEQEINHVRFKCRPGYERGTQFDPG